MGFSAWVFVKEDFAVKIFSTQNFRTRIFPDSDFLAGYGCGGVRDPLIPLLPTLRDQNKGGGILEIRVCSAGCGYMSAVYVFTCNSALRMS